MDLSSTSQLLVVRLKKLFFCAKLSTTNSVHVVVAIVLLDLTKWEIAIRELLRHRDAIVNRLLPLSRAPAAKHAER